MKNCIAVLLTVCLLPVSGYSYGPHGHQLVGAIADKRLAKNATVANRIKQLLDGLTLEQSRQRIEALAQQSPEAEADVRLMVDFLAKAGPERGILR